MRERERDIGRGGGGRECVDLSVYDADIVENNCVIVYVQRAPSDMRDADAVIRK